MQALLDAPRVGHLFIAGTVAGQGNFYARFDAVVLLSAPVQVLLRRIASRTTNDFGTGSEDQKRIIGDVAAVEPLLRRRATLEVDARRPLDEVVESVLAAASPAPQRLGRCVPGRRIRGVSCPARSPPSPWAAPRQFTTTAGLTAVREPLHDQPKMVGPRPGGGFRGRARM
jgi:hypothetical protein